MHLASRSSLPILFYGSGLLRGIIAIDPGQLGIQVNVPLLRSSAEKLVLGSVVEIAGLSGWSNEQIVDMAFVAHDDRREAYGAYKANNLRQRLPGRPAATSVLVVDNTAYISSSLKGGAYLYQESERSPGVIRNPVFDSTHPCALVNQALYECQMMDGYRGGHRTGASCGEVMCVVAFCGTQNQENIAGAKVVTIFGESNQARIIPPCGAPNGNLAQGEWGCHDFTMATGLGFDVIATGTGRISTDVSPNDITITYATYP